MNEAALPDFGEPRGLVGTDLAVGRLFELDRREEHPGRERSKLRDGATAEGDLFDNEPGSLRRKRLA